MHIQNPNLQATLELGIIAIHIYNYRDQGPNYGLCPADIISASGHLPPLEVQNHTNNKILVESLIND